ncbi:MAG TPA: hypothetical protein VG942_10570 [Hyphomonadaceae bacterium]|nr:hypothetical protein [Hyphomonadaceae bacterium]
MSISTDYSIPVQVNGYSCRNCTEVAEAKKGVDPAHPKSGPYGVTAASDPTRKDDAVSFGGSLAGLNAVQGPSDAHAPSLQTSGSCVNVCC